MKSLHRRLLTGGVIIFFSTFAMPNAKAADIFATNPTGNWATAGSLYSVGTPVLVGATDLTVTALGFFDEGGDGLLDNHEVGIFDLSENLLGSVAIPAGTGATLSDGTRWVTLNTPINLSAGTSYMLAATFTASGDRGNAANSSQITIANGIALSGSDFTVANSSNLVYPGNNPSGSGVYIFGANMQFTPVPEPSSFVMLAIGAGIAAVARRRKLLA